MAGGARIMGLTFTQIYFSSMFWIAVICVVLWALLMAVNDY